MKVVLKRLDFCHFPEDLRVILLTLSNIYSENVCRCPLKGCKFYRT